MKIGIIGGGITGLTTSLALSKLGISSVVFEQAKAHNEIGAGIWLQPNAIKVLDWLGIKEKIQAQGNALNKVEITNAQLIPLKQIKSEIVQDDDGNTTVAIHRAKLQKILYEEAVKSNDVHLDKKYIGHTTDDNMINLQFENGAEAVDILLGADGINSSLRKSLFPNSSVRNSGQVCWRGVSNTKLPAALAKRGIEAWARQIRFGLSCIGNNEVYWFAVANEEHLAKAESHGKKDYILNLFREFSPVVSELIENTEASKIHQATLCDLKKLPLWYDDNICLMGDAAHATTPNMGQGAGQGIEDAYYLSKLLAKSSEKPSQTFEEFQKKRRKKVDYIVNTSWQFGKMAHSIIGQPFMKLMLKMTPESVMNAQMNKLYSIDK